MTKTVTLDNITLIKHDTIQNILEQYFHFPLSEIESMRGYDAMEGCEYEMSVSTAIENIKKQKCWGFCEKKKRIHIWFAKDVDKSLLISLIAHERGHMQRPFHRDEMKEEKKAALYEEIAMFSYKVMKGYERCFKTCSDK